MSIRQRVLTTRLAERAKQNPVLAKQMGIEIRYKQMSPNSGSAEKTTKPVDAF